MTDSERLKRIKGKIKTCYDLAVGMQNPEGQILAHKFVELNTEINKYINSKYKEAKLASEVSNPSDLKLQIIDNLRLDEK